MMEDWIIGMIVWYMIEFKILSVLFNMHIIYYVSYIGMFYVNIIGFGLFSSFIIQFFSGILLCIYYNSCFIFSFDSIVYIMIDVLFGFLIRGFHCIGAVLFIFMVFIHVLRGVWLRLLNIDIVYVVWLSGSLLLLLVIIEGFIGYCLNLGQMSYWGYKVMLDLFWIIGIYIIGLVYDILWNSMYVVVFRIFLLHFMIGWFIGIFMIMHILVLHGIGSNNPMISSLTSYIMSFRLVALKDIMMVVLLVGDCILGWMGWEDYDICSNEDNLEVANPLSTPEHIIPEIYFLIVYYLLRCLEIKFMGVVCICVFILLVLN